MMRLQGADLPLKDLGSLLCLLGERKRRLEQVEAESNMEVLLDFLYLSRQRKQEEMQEVKTPVQAPDTSVNLFIVGKLGLLGDECNRLNCRR